jgi:hypothetical protein
MQKWERSPKEDRRRLLNIAKSMKAACHKYARGCETWHIKGHTCGDKMEKEAENRKLEFHYNNWCDQSARKNIRYGLKGKKIIHCQGFEDADKHKVAVPEGAFIARKESLAQNL